MNFLSGLLGGGGAGKVQSSATATSTVGDTGTGFGGAAVDWVPIVMGLFVVSLLALIIIGAVKKL